MPESASQAVAPPWASAIWASIASKLVTLVVLAVITGLALVLLRGGIGSSGKDSAGAPSSSADKVAGTSGDGAPSALHGAAAKEPDLWPAEKMPPALPADSGRLESAAPQTPAPQLPAGEEAAGNAQWERGGRAGVSPSALSRPGTGSAGTAVSSEFWPGAGPLPGRPPVDPFLAGTAAGARPLAAPAGTLGGEAGAETAPGQIAAPEETAPVSGWPPQLELSPGSALPASGWPPGIEGNTNAGSAGQGSGDTGSNSSTTYIGAMPAARVARPPARARGPGSARLR